jgi:hypothetical protein
MRRQRRPEWREAYSPRNPPLASSSQIIAENGGVRRNAGGVDINVDKFASPKAGPFIERNRCVDANLRANSVLTNPNIFMPARSRNDE